MESGVLNEDDKVSHAPFESDRLASVWTTKKCGKTPGWNLLRISSIMSLIYLLPTATKILLAACCHSATTSCEDEKFHI